MNPFIQQPLPPDTRGARGFASAAEAKATAQGAGVTRALVILQSGAEFAWISPIEAFMVRALNAAAAGISVVEWVQ